MLHFFSLFALLSSRAHNVHVDEAKDEMTDDDISSEVNIYEFFTVLDNAVLLIKTDVQQLLLRKNLRLSKISIHAVVCT